MDDDVKKMLAGPRGRRLALEHAMAIADATRRDRSPGADLRSAVFAAAYRDDSNPWALVVPTVDAAEPTSATPRPSSPDDVAACLRDLPLTPLDARTELEVLDRVLCSAMSWQPPDAEDVLAAAPVVRAALAPVAAHVLATPAASWWSEGIAREQHVLRWADVPASPVPVAADIELDRWRARTLAGEERALRNRQDAPEVAWSGEWWSTPPRTLTTSTRGLGELGPVGLWLMEDNPGWDHATSRAASVPDGARVYEVDGAAAWAQLCRDHPMDVTGDKRHDWLLTTGRDGTWVIPDWSAVARDYDAVHLTLAGYLQAAGTAIAVEDETASVIAGWAPDETFWLTDALGHCLVDAGRGAQSWTRGDAGWFLSEGEPTWPLRGHAVGGTLDD